MKLGLSLGGLVAMQMGVSLATQLIVFAVIGAGTTTDAWVAAQAVPMIVFSIASVAFQGAWQARLAVAAIDVQRWRHDQGVALGQLLLVAGCAILLLSMTAGVWTRWVFPGFSTAQLGLTAELTRLLLMATLLNCLVALLTTALRARERFVGPELLVLAVALVSVALTPFALHRLGIHGAALLNVARAALAGFALFWMAGRPMPRIRAAWRDHVQWRQVRPLLLGSSLYKIGPLVDRFWTSLAPAGGMTAFNFIHMGMGALATVLERALCMPVHPRLARQAEAHDYDGMRALYRQRVGQVAVLTALALLVLLLLYPVWPQLMRPALKLDDAALRQTWWLCLVLMGYVLPAAAGSVVVSSFYALGDTRTPVRVGTIGFCLSVLTKAAGFLLGGMTGLALAIVTHYVGNMIAMCWLLERRLGAAIAMRTAP